jgi:hypothetical protein
MNDATAANTATNGQTLVRRRGGAGVGASSSAGTLPFAVLALVMCLLVLGVAGAVVLRDGLRDGTDKGATIPAPTRRGRASRPAGPVRSGALLLAWTAGVGVLTGAVLGLVGLVLALALRSVGGAAP